MHTLPALENLWSSEIPTAFYTDDNPEADGLENDIFMRSLYGQPFPFVYPQENPPQLNENQQNPSFSPELTRKRRQYMDPSELYVSTAPQVDSQPPLKTCKPNEDDEGPIDPGSEEQPSSKQLSFIDVLFRIKQKAEALLVEHADTVEEYPPAPSAQNLVDRVDELFGQITQVLNEQKLRKEEPLKRETDQPRAILRPSKPLSEDFQEPQASVEDDSSISKENNEDDKDSVLESGSSMPMTASEADVPVPEPLRTLPIHIYLQGNKKRSVMCRILSRMINENTINARDPNGDTPLHIAIRNKRKSTVLKLLIELGASTKAQNLKGNTCLHEAVVVGKAETVKILLNRGAHPSVTNQMGLLPKDCCEKIITKRAKEDIRRLFNKYKPGVRFPESTEISRYKLLKKVKAHNKKS